jgi:large subunit ribosomal protein L16
MLLFPNKPKYFVKFTNKKLLTFNTKKTSILRYSQIGLLAKCSGFISNFQIEAVRLYLRRLAKKRSQLFFRVFPDQPITKKPNQVRMGRGVGGLKY